MFKIHDLKDTEKISFKISLKLKKLQVIAVEFYSIYLYNKQL